MKHNFSPGWHQANHSDKFHWFEKPDHPICKQKIRKTDEYLTPIGINHSESKTFIGIYTGGCPKCIKRLQANPF